MNKCLAAVALASVGLAGCTSVGQVGIMTKPTADPGALIREAHPYQDLGPARGKACRFFVLAIIPFGDSAASTALDKALAQSGGDALLNVTVSTSLYGFIPIYNVLSFTCTTVDGIAIRYQPAADLPPGS